MLRSFRSKMAKAIQTRVQSRRLPARPDKSFRRHLELEALEPRLVLNGQSLLISELLAINDDGLADEDGEFSDWIEIYNPTANPVQLDGWFLTDDRADLTKWQFPNPTAGADVVLDPGDHLVVFASNKDRFDVPGELHTDFRLTSSGEYLGLIQPDGATIAHEYVPQFPQQYSDISYGLAQGVDTSTLIDAGAAATVLIPSNGGLAETWTAIDFNDNGWTAGATGIGYDTGSDYDPLIGADVRGAMRNQSSTAYIRVPFQVADPTAIDTLQLRMKYDDGFVAYLNGVEVADRNAPIDPDWGSAATAEHGHPESSTMVQDFDGGGTLYTFGQYGSDPAPAVLGGGPDGDFLRLIYDGAFGNVNRAAFDKIHQGPASQIVADFDFRITSADPSNPADGFSFLLLPTSTYGDSGLGTDGTYASEEPNVWGVFAVGFDTYPDSSGVNDVSAHWNSGELINVTLTDAQLDLDAGVFHHAHVELVQDGPDSRVTVTLTPDVFGSPGAPVTPINNVLIPGLEPYESRVEFSARTGGLAMDVDLDNIRVEFGAISNEIAYEDIDLTDQRGLLQAGDNVLAIHGLNIQSSDEDFLILPQLLSQQHLPIQIDTPTYFAEPTPGAPNATGSDAPSAAPLFSQAGGTYVDSFALVISAGNPGAVIRYTTDGSVPTEASPVYTDPLVLSTTTRIRARAMEPGRALGPIVSHGYLFLDATVAGFNSDVPLIVLDTFGMGLGDSLLTPTSSVFIETGVDGRAQITDSPEFAGRAGLRIRGQSSQGWPKSQFAFETWAEGGQDTAPIAAQAADDLAVSLFGMPAESDWVIQGPYSDKTLMRNFLSYNWSNDIGQYAPRTRFCEVFVNLDGGKIRYPEDYVGVYVFMEKIKRDSNRVDIAELLPSHNSEPEITGGYIYKKDKPGAGDVPFYTSTGQELRHVEPKARDITPQQQAYLESYINAFETALYGPDFTDPDLGYAAYIDVDSFIDTFILVELTKNIDGFRLSTYYHKDRGGKIQQGPAWDYNLSLGNADYLEGWTPEGWYGELLPPIDSLAYPYWERLFEDPNFTQGLADRWAELRQDVLSNEKLLGDVDEAAAIINEAQVRNFQKYDILGSYLWPNGFVGQTWEEDVAWMRQWLDDRLAWIDAQFVARVEFSQEGGAIEPGFELTLSGPPGTIYYTLDGSDPRDSGGGVSATALEFRQQTNSTTLISPGSSWKYLDDGSDQGAAWRPLTFDDSTWDDGPAQLGYGDGDEATEVSYGGDANNKHITTYFRHTFNLADPPQFNSLTMEVLRDDGAVIYLNGQELPRSNMPGGSITYTTRAFSAVAGNAESTFYTYAVDPTLLVQGDNVVAVEIHQAGPTSSDISFDLELYGINTIPLDTIVLNDSTLVTARVADNNRWSAPSRARFFVNTPAAAENLVVSEINYNPHVPTPAEVAAGFLNNDDFEFIELKNIGPDLIELPGLQFVQQPSGIEFAFPDTGVTQLQPGEFVVVANNPAAVAQRYGSVTNLLGPYAGKLSNGGEQLTLINAFGETIFSFSYGDSNDPSWPDRADGTGASLELIDPQAVPVTDPERTTNLQYADNWRSSSEYLGTPGTTGQGPYAGVVINEVLTHTDDPLVDAIELYNPTGIDVPIGGWWLSDSNADFLKFQIPAGTVVPAGGYVVFYEGHYVGGVLQFDPQFEFGGAGPKDFALSGSRGDDVWLLIDNGGGSPLRFADHVEFGSAFNGESFGRWPDDTGDLYPMTRLTLDPGDGQNSGPRAPLELLISEVMYSPPDPGTGVPPDDLEYLEIYNTTAQPVDLTGWRTRKGLDFDFVPASNLGPNEALVIVSFDPNDPVKLADFRDHYGIGPEVQIVGGHTDRLSDIGERIQLQRPDDPPADDPLYIPHPIEDEVNYENTWYPTTAGSGQSLNRLAVNLWGNDPASWAPLAPSPGAVNISEENNPPVADANGPYRIDIGDDLTFDAGDSYDPDQPSGDAIVRYRWDLESDGSFEYDTSAATQLVPWAELQNLPQPGAPISITLEVTDSFGLTDTDVSSLVIYENQPAASFTAAPNPAAPEQSITFDASGSHHDRPDRSIVSYDWDFDNDGQFDDATGQIVTHSFSQFGQYPVSLRVTDDNVPAKTDTAGVQIDVDLGNNRPVADADGPYWIDVGDGLLLDGSGSSDPNEASGDAIVRYRWDLESDGSFEYDTSAATQLVPWAELQNLPQPGAPISITLEVTDSFGLTDTDVSSLVIYENQPAASFTAAPNPAAPEQSITFDASGSHHDRPDRSIVSYDWDFDDGGTLSTPDPVVTYSYDDPGEFTVTLTVGDDNVPPRSDSTDLLMEVNGTVEISDRYVFYNNSAWDDPGRGGSDSQAIATDKVALLPGQEASFANYTSYVRGINGIIIDVLGLANPGAIDATDFTFKLGNDDTPADWSDAPMPSIDVMPGPGGADRILMSWDDNAITNTWLEVTVLVTANTGLPAADVFYFGNLVGECTGDGKVKTFDVRETRNSPRPFFDPALLDTLHDFNRDRRVNAIDTLIVRNNQTWSATELELIDLSGAKKALAEAKSRALRPDGQRARDAALVQLLGQVSDDAIDASAKMSWLYDFEQVPHRQQRSGVVDPVGNAADKLRLDKEL